MIDILRSLVASLEKLPEAYQEEAARRIEPIVEELVDRRWEEQLARIPDDAWERLDTQLAQDRAEGRFQPISPSTDCGRRGGSARQIRVMASCRPAPRATHLARRSPSPHVP